jgi:DNA repair exonuclease SbcCD ATPase subunit
MPQVSIGQIESLDELVRDLLTIYEQTQNECILLTDKIIKKTNEVENEVVNSQRLMEAAEEALREACRETEEAEQRLIDAQAGLSDAESALSACEASGDYDDEGNYILPNCSFEESEAATAIEEVSGAEQSLAEARDKLVLAEEKQRYMGNRLELANETLFKPAKFKNPLLSSFGLIFNT